MGKSLVMPRSVSCGGNKAMTFWKPTRPSWSTRTQPDEAAASRKKRRWSASRWRAARDLPYAAHLILPRGAIGSGGGGGARDQRDALKQRLARGREMLRERMAASIEITLTRTAPTAVFTMTMAAAIGALTAPAAGGGTVSRSHLGFRCLHGSRFQSSILTAMTTSKALLVATASSPRFVSPIELRIHTAVAPESITRTRNSGLNCAHRPNLRRKRALCRVARPARRYGTNAQSNAAPLRSYLRSQRPLSPAGVRAALISSGCRWMPPAACRSFLPRDGMRRSGANSLRSGWRVILVPRWMGCWPAARVGRQWRANV